MQPQALKVNVIVRNREKIMPSFERFMKTGKSYLPKVSIRANGQLGLNQGAVEKFDLKAFQYAVLFFDKKTKTIGIKPTNDQEEGVCKLQIRSMNGAVGAKAFLDYYAIPYKKTERYSAEWDEKLQMIVTTFRR